MVPQVETIIKGGTDHDLVNIMVRAQDMYMAGYPDDTHKRAVKDYLSEYFLKHVSNMKANNSAVFSAQILAGRPIQADIDIFRTALIPRIFYWFRLAEQKARVI